VHELPRLCFAYVRSLSDDVAKERLDVYQPRGYMVALTPNVQVREARVPIDSPTATAREWMEFPPVHRV
jgi:hypothetical protein